MKSHIRVGSIEIELKCKGNAFLGLGRISCNGLVMRAGDLPIRPFTATHDGIEYDRYEIEDVQISSRRAVIRTRAIGVMAAVPALQDHSLDPAWSTSPWDGRTAAVDRMDWIIEADERNIGGRTFTGFSYCFRFRSAKREIYHIMDRATWELGGDAVGITLLRQQMGTDPMVTLRRNTAYNTSAIIGFPLNPVMTHDLPRWASEQSFDYQYKDGVALVGVFDCCGLIRTIVKRDAGCRSIYHFDKHIFDQTGDGRTVRKFIGACAGVGDDTDQMNMWTRVFDADEENVLKEFGMRRTQPRTTLSQNYWFNFTADTYRKDLIPAAAALGFQQVFIDTFWENDMTRKVEKVLPDYSTGSMCCPHEYEVGRAVGGIPAYRRLARDARKLGVEIISWTGTHQSQYSPYFAKHPAQVIKGPDGRHFYGSGYDCIYGMDMNSDFGPMWTESMIRACKATGVAGYLYDSFFNFGWMPVNFFTPDPKHPGDQNRGRLAARTQWRQIAKSMAALQKAGVHMLIESLGPWGQPQHGVMGKYNRPGSEPLAYQCAVGIGYSVIPVPGAKVAQDGPEVYYRFLANKAPTTLNLWNSAPGAEKPVRIDHLNSPLLRQANLDYRTVLPLMHTRTLLPGQAGVMWKPARGKQRVVFSYKKQVFPLSSRIPCKDQSAGCKAERRGDSVVLQPWHTYVIG